MPLYNGESYVKYAINSVLRQKFSNFEILLSDDGSNDSTLSIISSFNDPRIRILKFDTHRGLFGNLNKLIHESKTGLIHILCQDDVMEENCLEAEYEFLSLHTKIGIAFCKHKIINEFNEILITSVFQDLPEVMEPELSIQHFFYHGCIPGNLSTVIVKKECIIKAGFFDESFKLSGDYDLWSRITKDVPMGVIHKQLIRLRNHPKKLSYSDDAGEIFIEENTKIRKSLIKYLPKDRLKSALIFEKRRHKVLDFHYGIKCMLKFQLKKALRVFHTFKFLEICYSFFWWLITANNLLYRPQARWKLPDNDYRINQMAS